ncbi:MULTISPECIES: HipA N-terminal domain-containing protein [Aphanothece]|uniref:HipA N-terminal domain-containing protein n=1 Tax=Aphanothece TaxID=1121 RepID=UPI0039852EB4
MAWEYSESKCRYVVRPTATATANAAAEEEVIRAPSQQGQLPTGLRRQRGLSQSALAQKAGGLSQARLSALELNPGRFTLERMGEWRVPGRGPQEFHYDPAWLSAPQFRPLSLSLPVGLGTSALRGEVVERWFANLLPDNEVILRRLQRRFSLRGTSAFELLEAVGRDCAGAVQLLPPRRGPPAWIALKPRRSRCGSIKSNIRIPEVSARASR